MRDARKGAPLIPRCLAAGGIQGRRTSGKQSRLPCGSVSLRPAAASGLPAPVTVVAGGSLDLTGRPEQSAHAAPAVARSGTLTRPLPNPL